MCDRRRPFGLIAQGTDVGGDGMIMAAAVVEQGRGGTMHAERGLGGWMPLITRLPQGGR